MIRDNNWSMAQQGSSLFHSDPLTATDFFDSYKRLVPLESEKRLMLAVLEDAVQCYQQHRFARSGKDKTLFQEAEAWILQRDDLSLFSFDNVCEALGLAPAWVRAGLLKGKERPVAQRIGHKPASAGVAKQGGPKRHKRRRAA